jgi:hypothetical protein
MKAVEAKSIFPLTLRSDLTVSTKAEMADLIVAEARDQVKAKRLTDKDDRGEFFLGCLALLFLRMRLRVVEDHGDAIATRVMARVKELVCEKAGCDEDEFDLALVAVKDRPRVPYGLTPLQLALVRAQKKPIRLQAAAVAGSKITALIAALALHLQAMQPDGPIMLPVDDLRVLLELRKLSVSGALMQLVDNGVLRYIDATYHTGRARTFKFVGKEGKDFEFEEAAPE